MSATPTAVSCRIPACDGRWHDDGSCVVSLPDVDLDGPDASLVTELSSDDGQAPHIVAFTFTPHSLEGRRDMRDQADAAEFTAQLRRLADAIDTAAVCLPKAVAP